ncbi:heme anaerobic degradation radical SAM methyltransferase ChuW/HutW [Halorhodospira halochloris]|uniref:heme anaerobic degradation radical SAM methyltransferase ChuW/HutW n=1 Tax=Halorhodospira halochloris TaxID=1052 RepID=UPI001EE8EA84|nr:heme anaerobic degradation radical SAM methyltransferase ChuW/HutW [Halorhodospira halochloris]MCG5529885.1 heme anaerobic degradation radical SAM methyltransferase ChuW/HutW [Halorhodospira halochloris]MCG5549417.1 heme anaerobic degradation radical SAM methyltransferase ChuW/HutW [Halorhodospira halochloris]
MNSEQLDRFYPNITSDPLRFAFSGRTPLMPRQEKQFVTNEDKQSIWHRLEQSESHANKRVVYVNIPFCVNHCLYCGFFRNRYTPDKASAYVDLLIQELEREAELPHVGQRPIHALYLGGGTPTALSAADLMRLVKSLRKNLPLAPDCEITLEGRVLHFDEEKVDGCFDAGVNRISIGIQSFDTKVRQRQGRKVDGNTAADFIARLIKRERGAIILDLMYGLPWQTTEVWLNDLRTCIELGPDGIDVYALKRIPGTPLDKAISKNKMPATSDLGEQALMYRQASEMLTQAGWRQISNSHWARTTRERNLYNLLIKSGAECLAFGSGAGGSIEPYSYSITPVLEDYTEQITKGQKPIGHLMVSDSLQPLRDLIMGSIEVGRLDLDEFYSKLPANLSHHPLIERLIERWCQAQLAERRGEVIYLLTPGRFWAPNLISGLQGVCANLIEKTENTSATKEACQ